MTHYRSVGAVPPKRHTQHRAPDGSLYYEELVGAEGFSSDSSLLYHRHLPSAISAAPPWEPPAVPMSPNFPLLPRHFRLHELPESDAVTGRHLILGNADVRITYATASVPSPLYRNAEGDECAYIERGRARLETSFGAIEVGERDLVVIPRSTTHRWVPLDGGPVSLYVVESRSGHIVPPKRYLSARGQLMENAPYCERDLRGPGEVLVSDETDVDVHVRHRGGGTVFTYPHHPFDVVGWDGCLYPYAFDIRDFEPITGRVHQPPTVHQVFDGASFVICAFVPRKVDYHPLSVPVPYYHSNVDSDEVMFYVGGDYEARKGSGIGLGSVSLHPGGHTHGPQPGAVEHSLGAERFDEWAIMVDTFRPLELGSGALACEDPAYAWSWARPT